jgi:flavorubredoxin
MKEAFKATKINDHVYWVGAIDWEIRDFHGYDTPRGSTYNAYLILDDKITLIDTAKAHFRDEILGRIASVIDPEDISYVISDHSEMDHTGCLSEVVKAVKPEKVFASRVGVKTLAAQFHMDYEIEPLKEGDTLSLGNLNLSFIETKMLHWPDSMMTYLNEDKLLFSQDAFGMHLASGERFADEIDDDILEYEGEKYYANIILPYSSIVLKLLDKLKEMELEIDVIAPDHGPIWRQDISRMPEFYAKWATQKPTRKAVIVYETMWESTTLMAHSIGEGLTAGGVDVKLMPLKGSQRSEVVTEVLSAGALLVGSSTLNNNMLPPVADVLTYLKGLKPINLIGAAFGSYGWTGEAVGQINDILSAMKVELIGDGIKARYVPEDDVLKQCYELGSQIAAELNKRCDDEGKT